MVKDLSIDGYGAGYKGEVNWKICRAEFSSTAGGHGPPMDHCAPPMDGESGVLASGEGEKESFCLFLEKSQTSLLGGKLAQCPVENVASAVVPMELVGQSDTKMTPTGDGVFGIDFGIGDNLELVTIWHW